MFTQALEWCFLYFVETVERLAARMDVWSDALERRAASIRHNSNTRHEVEQYLLKCGFYDDLGRIIHDIHAPYRVGKRPTSTTGA